MHIIEMAILRKLAEYIGILTIVYFSSNILLKFYIISAYIYWNCKDYINLPPGPWGLPIVGYLLFMKNQPPHLFYVKASKKYGDLFSIKMGSNLVLCVGSTKLMKEIFSRVDSTERPRTALNALLNGLGIMLSDGDLWKRQRHFLNDKFRLLGIKMWTNTRIEEKIIMEIKEMLSKLDSFEGKPVVASSMFNRYIHNVICQLMMSFRFKENDTEFTTFNERVTRGMELYGLVHIGNYIKTYLKLPGKQAIINEIQRNLLDVSAFHGKKIIERQKLRSRSREKCEPIDLLDYYLEKIDEAKEQKLADDDKNNIFPGVDPVKQVIQVMNDLFSAGMETSLSTLLWILIWMIREPQVAATVRSELRKVVGPDDLVTMKHRSSLPYIEAVVFETIRIMSIVPLGTTHMNENEWQIGPYVIPPGTHIIPLINKMNMDPEIYPDPTAFKPERFIVNGNFRLSDTFMQFGYGPRICLGNTLARMELYLFLANLMNSYEFSLPDGEQLPGLQGVLGANHTPLPYKLVFKRLHE